MWQSSSDYFLAMEKYFKSQHSLTHAKSNGKSTESDKNAAFSVEEPVWKPRVFNNGFPKTHHVRRHHICGNRSSFSNENFQNSLSDDEQYPHSGKVINLHVPRLPMNNFSEHFHSDTNKRSFCSFIANNKMYLKKRGVNINTLYSFKNSGRRSNHQTPNDAIKMDAREKVLTNLKTQYAPEISKHLTMIDGSQSKSINNICTTNNQRLVRLMKGLEREAKISGHVRADETKGNHFGRVLTTTKLESILRKEEHDVQPAFSVQL